MLSRRQEAVVWLGLIAAVSTLWWPGLLWSHVPAFRDTFHFYYPLQVWLDSQVKLGNWFPLWNPHDGLGIGTPGEATTALFYPLRWIWWLPGLDVAQRCSVFIVLHSVLAAVAIRYAGSRLGLANSSSCYAAIAYAFSGPVFFLHVNIPYLCGAAWAPFAFAEIGRVMSGHNGVRVWVLAGSVSMMILAGDPQTAVNALLIFSLGITLRILRDQQYRSAGELVYKLLQVLTLAAGLTAIQWLPTLHATLQSERNSGTYSNLSAHVDVHPNAGPIWRDHSLDNLSQPQRNSRYDFSIPPWHFVSLVWPTIGGHYLPENSRWFQAIPAEGRMWTASMYTGTLTMLMLFAGIAQWVRFRRLMGVTLLCAFLAMGHYGPIWFLRQLMIGLGFTEWTNVLPADHVGSPLALLNSLVPGYSAFRYPGKWSIWVACGLSLVGATQLHRLSCPNYFTRCLIGLSALGLAFCLTTIHVRSLGWFDWWRTWLDTAPQDAWLGHPDALASLAGIQFSCALTIAVVAVHVTVQRLRYVCGHREAALILLTVIEMTICCRTWLHFVPSQLTHQAAQLPFDSRPCVWSSLAHANFERDSASARNMSPIGDRVQALCAYQQMFLLGKLHLLGHANNLGATMSLEPTKLKVVRGILASHDRLEPLNPKLDEYLSWLGVTHRLVRSVTSAQNSVSGMESNSQGDARYWPQLVWQPVPRTARFVELLSLDGQELEPEQGKVLVSRSTPSVIELSIDCAAPLQAVIRQHHDGLWRAHAAGPAHGAGKSRLTIERFARLFPSLRIPSCLSIITLRYSPWPLWWGCGVSALAWTSVLAHLAWSFFSRRRNMT